MVSTRLGSKSLYDVLSFVPSGVPLSGGQALRAWGYVSVRMAVLLVYNGPHELVQNGRQYRRPRDHDSISFSSQYFFRRAPSRSLDLYLYSRFQPDSGYRGMAVWHLNSLFQYLNSLFGILILYASLIYPNLPSDRIHCLTGSDSTTGRSRILPVH